MIKKGSWLAFLLPLVIVILSPKTCPADGIMDAFSSPIPPFDNPTLFPNWTLAPTASFIIVVAPDGEIPGCDDDPYITSVTVFNYGTAQAGTDIANVYFGLSCGNSYRFSGFLTMGYAGIWNVGTASYPAWTWSGSISMVDKKDPCDVVVFSSCACNVSLWLYTDIAPCPTEGATVELGPGYNPTSDPPGGIIDACDMSAPWSMIKDNAPKTIRYAVKKGDKDLVVPGDTINYSITYGVPGTSPLSNIVIIDTMPEYTHLLSGAVPAPDPTWDPNPGPPKRLRWTIPGPIDPTMGRTSQIRFAVSVDWGNMDWFEPGSGDLAAPEGAQLANTAQIFYNGSTCPLEYAIIPPYWSVVRRFLIWKVADNDMLFASSPGQDPDEIVYTIFIKNVSAKKTWWNVSIWDTVPAELDSWMTNCGFDDPCIGWTMTPSGCTPANPGYALSGTDTLLTWHLDLPPSATIQLRWKAKLKDSVEADSTAIGIANIMAYGATAIIDGTGNSMRPRTFAHLLRVILPTTYISYVGYGNVNYGTPYVLDFYPLNKKTQFVLYGLEYFGSGFAEDGGVSASINCHIGDCISGFAGNAGNCPVNPIPGGGTPGCGAERIPAQYLHPAVSSMPFNNIYKVVSNSPLAWQVLTERDSRAADHMTFAPSSSMSYTGLLHYFWRRTVSATQVPGSGDAISFINTGMDPYGNYDPTLRTTVHEFQFDFVTSKWQYRRTYELGPESQAFDNSTYIVDEGPWRSISSSAQLIVNHAYNFHSACECCCGACGHNSSSIWPTRERGNVVVGEGETAYGLVNGDRDQSTPNCVVGNLGGPTAVCQVYRYVPVTNVPKGVQGMPNDLRGTNGMWVKSGIINIPGAMDDPANPYIFPDHGAHFSNMSTGLFKVELLSGGPIQIFGGIGPFSPWGHGAVLHAADPLGNQTGTEYWLHHTYHNEWDGSPVDCGPGTHAIDIFCPRAEMEINAKSELNMNATYKTNAPDQCVAFRGLTDEPGSDRLTIGKTVYQVLVNDNPAKGDVIAMYFSCGAEKGFTAPFMAMGVRYEIRAPSVAFLGQKFWITIVVLDATKSTKTDYVGTTGFTSTDPGALTESVPLGIYQYTWTGFGGDEGVHLFMDCSMSQIGVQSIIARDINDGSIVGLTAIRVVATDVKLWKEPRLTSASSGDTVEFKICWSNYSSSSAEAFTITDRIPNGFTYLQADHADHICGGTYGDPGIGVSYSVTDDQPTSFLPVGTPGPVSALWLRWSVPMIAIKTTGCACFKARIN